jgi:hypothetical protein
LAYSVEIVAPWFGGDDDFPDERTQVFRRFGPHILAFQRLFQVIDFQPIALRHGRMDQWLGWLAALRWCGRATTISTIALQRPDYLRLLHSLGVADRSRLHY